MMDLLQIHRFSLQDVKWWTGVWITVMFLSAVWTYYDGTHSLHWWASDAMLNFSTSIPVKKQTPPHFGWPEGEYTFQILNGLFTYSLDTFHALAPYWAMSSRFSMRTAWCSSWAIELLTQSCHAVMSFFCPDDGAGSSYLRRQAQ